MLAGTKPRSPTPRVARTPTSPPISYSPATARPSSQTTVTSLPLSPPATPSRARRPSISNTMHWLTRSSQASSSSPYAPAKSTRISEPKLIRSTELLSQPRSGTLGSGATVVRTPDEALRETGVRLTYDGKAEARSQSPDSEQPRASTVSERSLSAASFPSPTSSSTEELSPESPALPPVPMPEVEEKNPEEAQKLPPRPTRAPLSVPSPSIRPSLKSRPFLQAEDAAHVPALPAHLSTTPTPPPFRALLISEAPHGAVDHSKFIVTVETSTAVHKTTLETLKSRPSNLSEYLGSLFSSRRLSDASSVYSDASEDMSAYRHHLTSQGLLPQTSFSLHLFLDRPSTPYTHIFNYLRSLPGSSDAPETLPRSVQMLPSHQRLEGLLELRDEAAYLGLDGLHKLCVDEIRMRHAHRLHSRGQSSSSLAQSLHVLLERVESDMHPSPRDSRSSHSRSTKEGSVDMRSPPTPESWNGSSRVQHSPAPARSPPAAGWI
ncbi:hypothetical protein H0H87_009670 [Tephrocybe sp. NHM501043]|nr:hypothetical protein H0H87_009670 [Tephrocybe sp. NHM501043]